MISKTALSMRIVLPLLCVTALSATPRLNLVQNAITVSVPTGSNGPTYTAYTFNIGSGTLKLQAASSVPWLVPTVGSETVCGIQGGCYPISIAFQTSSLTAGTYVGIITLTDPNAIDSPQTISVTANVGGDVPSSLTFYVAPGSSATQTITTNGAVKAKVSGASWLTTSTANNEANGDYVTTITATAASSMNATAYQATITTTGSSFTADNKTINVTLNVTTQPIAQASSSSVLVNLAQNGQSAIDNLAVTNAGQGTLTVSGVTATASDSGTWLTAATINGGISITSNPTGLAPGNYTGTVTVASNGANGNIVIPVQAIVAAQGPPVAEAGGVVANDTFASGEALAQGDIASIFGNQFTYDAPTPATNTPLGTTLDNVQVLVNGTAAPLYYTSAGQINFQVPFDATVGAGTVQVVRNGTNGNLVYVNIAAQAPQFLISSGDYAIIQNPTTGALTGIPGSPTKVGDTVVIYAIGLGPTSPAVASGAATPNSPLSNATGSVQVCFGVITPFSQPPCAKPLFAGLTPGFVGLYQINVTIPSAVKSGNTTMSVLLENNTSSDPVELAVQ